MEKRAEAEYEKAKSILMEAVKELQLKTNKAAELVFLQPV
jgi:hypothetical protein